LNLIDDQPGYQKAGYEEEYVDADKATARRMQPGVEGHDGQYRHRPQAVYIRPVTTGVVDWLSAWGLHLMQDTAPSLQPSDDMSHLAPKASQCRRDPAGVLRKT